MQDPATPLGTTADTARDGDRAISEVIAFILSFAIVLGAVALLSATGFQAMADFQENEQLTNAERGMTSLADNFNDVLRYDGVDQRFGELTLRGGTVRTASENTTMEIDTGGTDSKEIELGALTYEAGSDIIAYEGGGVFRGSGDGSAVVKQPPLRCTSDSSGSNTAVISIMKIDQDEDRSVQSDSGIGMTISKTGMERATNMSEIDTDPNGDVTITIDPDDTPYEHGWYRALTRNGWDGDRGSDEYECPDVDTLELQIVTAELEY